MWGKGGEAGEGGRGVGGVGGRGGLGGGMWKGRGVVIYKEAIGSQAALGPGRLCMQ